MLVCAFAALTVQKGSGSRQPAHRAAILISRIRKGSRCLNCYGKWIQGCRKKPSAKAAALYFW